MIDKVLNNYKKNEAAIQMLKIKINQWNDILTKDIQEIDLIYSKKYQDNLGMQKNRKSNPIESMYIRVEEQKKKINLWIKESNEMIIELEKEQQMANILIDSLDEESKFIVIQKHFEKKKWNIITHQFNSKYRNEYHEYITSSGVRKKYDTAKKALSTLLEEVSRCF